VPHVEFDALFWEANWTEAPTDVFRDRVARATAGDGWVACGYYSRSQDVVWPRADTLVWLDPPLRVIARRAIQRTVWRSLRRTDLWGSGNREKLSNLWNKDESLFLWAKREHARRIEQFTAAIASPAASHLTVVRLRSPSAARQWLRSVTGR
jgi:hypothetical protein